MNGDAPTSDSPIHHVMHDFAIELRRLAYTMPAGHEDRLIHLSDRMVQRCLQVQRQTG